MKMLKSVISRYERILRSALSTGCPAPLPHPGVGTEPQLRPRQLPAVVVPSSITIVSNFLFLITDWL